MILNPYERLYNFNGPDGQSFLRWGFKISHPSLYILEIIRLGSQVVLTNPLPHAAILLQTKFPVKTSRSCTFMNGQTERRRH